MGLDNKHNQDSDSSNMPKQDEVNRERRALLRAAVGLGAGAAIGVGRMERAFAKNEDRPYEKTKKEIREDMGLPEDPDQLKEDEIVLMNETLNCLSRLYIQPSFFQYALPVGKRGEVKNLMEDVIKHYDELHYEKNNYGYIVVTKRKSNKPSPNIKDGFRMVIRDGIITNIGGFEVDSDAISKWNSEWDKIKDKIENINNKALNPEAELLTIGEKKWYEDYNMTLPRNILGLLKAKSAAFPLTKAEQEVLDELTKLIPNHPSNYGEQGKKLQFHVKIKPKDSKNPTPDYAAELVYPKTDPTNPRKTFGVFSFEGFIMEKKKKEGTAPEKQIKEPDKKTQIAAIASMPGFEAMGKILEQSQPKTADSASTDNQIEKTTSEPTVWQKSSRSFAELYKEKIEK